MVELEHTCSILEQMRLHTAAQLLDTQLEQSLHSQQTHLKLARLPHTRGWKNLKY